MLDVNVIDVSVAGDVSTVVVDASGAMKYAAAAAASAAESASYAAAAAGSSAAIVAAHVSDTSNPHSVTKAQVGLSNVDNTSDVDKPISSAMQAALDLKPDFVDAIINGDVISGGSF